MPTFWHILNQNLWLDVRKVIFSFNLKGPYLEVNTVSVILLALTQKSSHNLGKKMAELENVANVIWLTLKWKFQPNA